jgi:hypothetical protein
MTLCGQMLTRELSSVNREKGVFFDFSNSTKLATWRHETCQPVMSPADQFTLDGVSLRPIPPGHFVQKDMTSQRQ